MLPGIALGSVDAELDQPKRFLNATKRALVKSKTLPSCHADAHTLAVSACVFLDGPSMTALTADLRGRLIFHNVSAYVSLMGAPAAYRAAAVIFRGLISGMC